MVMKLAVIRIRGRRKMNPQISRTLELLRLERTNHCIVIDDSPQNLGMLRVVKDYVAFGPVDEEVIYRLLYKRGEKGSKPLRSALKEDDLKKAASEIFSGKKVSEFGDPVFRLRPPSRGYRNIKLAYPRGDLGKRDDMSALLRRML